MNYLSLVSVSEKSSRTHEWFFYRCSCLVECFPLRLTRNLFHLVEKINFLFLCLIVVLNQENTKL